MRDLPPIAWILGLFVFFAILIAMYASNKPEPLPPAKSAWSYVESFRSEIEFRKTSLRPGTNQEFVDLPYRVQYERLSDVDSPQVMARYVVHVFPSGKMPLDRPWFGSQADIVLVDTEPKEGIGHVRVVALRRVEELIK